MRSGEGSPVAQAAPALSGQQNVWTHVVLAAAPILVRVPAHVRIVGRNVSCNAQESKREKSSLVYSKRQEVQC